MISIDPGVHACGWAEWSASLLICAGLGTPNLLGHATVVVERPQVDGRTRKIKLQDVLDLSYAAGAAGGAGAVKVFPRDWKGNVPKKVMARRIDRSLDPAERRVLAACLVDVPKDLQHNVWDAVGIGLWHLGRLR